jgi:transposase
MSGFRGKAPGAGSGEMSRRTQALRPLIALDAREATKARKLRRAGAEPAAIAEALGVPVEEVEKALVQMRSPRPETTRGTLNVTLAAHRMIMQERVGDEPIWQTVDRMLDELLRRRAAVPERRAKTIKAPAELPLLTLTKT